MSFYYFVHVCTVLWACTCAGLLSHHYSSCCRSDPSLWAPLICMNLSPNVHLCPQSQCRMCRLLLTDGSIFLSLLSHQLSQAHKVNIYIMYDYIFRLYWLEVTWLIRQPLVFLSHFNLMFQYFWREWRLFSLKGQKQYRSIYHISTSIKTMSMRTLKHTHIHTQKAWEIVLWSVCSCIPASDTPFIILWIIALYLLKPIIKLTLEGRPRKRESKKRERKVEA